MLSPFRGFMDVQGEMNRILDEAFGGFARQAGRRQENGVSRWAPAIDAVSEDGDLVIRAELPGVKLEDVDITLQNGVLNISGERKAEHQKEGSGYYVRERRHGSFRRSMSLPEGINEENIHARFEDGVLEVRVEGAAAIKEPKRIAIEGADDQSSGG